MDYCLHVSPKLPFHQMTFVIFETDEWVSHQSFIEKRVYAIEIQLDNRRFNFKEDKLVNLTKEKNV